MLFGLGPATAGVQSIIALVVFGRFVDSLIAALGFLGGVRRRWRSGRMRGAPRIASPPDPSTSASPTCLGIRTVVFPGNRRGLLHTASQR